MLERPAKIENTWTYHLALLAASLSVAACGGEPTLTPEDVVGKGDGRGRPGIMITWRNEMEKWAQTDSDWATDRLFLGSGCNTMHNGGCAITSRAMVESYYTSERVGRRDPGALNRCLARSGVPKGCLLPWTRCLPEGVSYLGRAPARLSTIRADIDAGHPVIAQVPIEGGSHFVVIVGYAFPGTALRDFVIYDPGCGCSASLASFQEVNSIRRFRGPVLPR